ncbi:MAG: AAA family ATPase [Candidatus Heimdallarchaeaceae archaeon]|jgi:chromosome segregation protein
MTLAQDNYIFKSLKLHNFKMHKQTELNLEELPITVISGANGSGKTQILEALILAVGHTPSRVSLGSSKDLVGQFDDKCFINLELNNPTLSEERVISLTDPDLTSLANNETFCLEIEISTNGKIKRKIAANGKSKDITRAQVQRIMKSLGIYEDTMLNFTEEGYLSSFADGSPHKKLTTLLAATGLKEIFISYLDSKKRVDEKEKEISPLILQLEKEQNKLSRLEENLERMQKKKELITRYEEVEKELHWFDSLDMKKQLKEATSELKNKETEFSQTKEKALNKNKKHDDLLVKCKELEEKSLDFKIVFQKKSDKLNQLKGQKEEKERKLLNLKEKISEIVKQIKDFKTLNTSEGLEKKIQLQEELDNLKAKVKTLIFQKESIVFELENSIKEEESIKKRIDERSEIYGNLSNYERNLIKNTITYKERIRTSSFKDEIIGPLYEVLEIKSEFQEYENVIKSAIGKYLYSFVATSQDAYEEAKRIYDEIFLQYKPNITVGRILEEKEGPKPDYLFSQKLDKKPDGVLDFVVNLLEAPPQVKIFLRKFCKIILALPHLSPNILTDFARQSRANILTADGLSFYLSQEAFGRPPQPYNVKLGVDLGKYQSIERIREQLDNFYRKAEALKTKEQEYSIYISSLEVYQREMESKLKPWTATQDELEKEFLKFENLKTEFEDQYEVESEENSKLKESITILGTELVEEEKELKKQQSIIDKEKEKINRVSQSLQNLRDKREKILKHLDLLSMEVEELKTRNKQLLKIAKEKGETPGEIREDRIEIFTEYNKIKGQLELLEITPEVKLESVDNQKKIVDELEKEAQSNEDHLKNLKKDLERRIDEWEGGLYNIVTHLNRMLNLLLRDTFDNMSVKITNYNEERNAELIIEAETKGDKRSYRQLSGGEKTLIAQAIILALHMINHSPIHAIDEFTQKLDKKNRALAFSMALATYNLAKENRMISPQFILITPMLDDVDLSKEFSHKVLIESKVTKTEEK